MDQIALCRCRVLYLGSSVPLETTVGIESIQNPCRDRFSQNVDSNNRASGIDSVLSVYSGGILLQFSGDDSGTKQWFPIQSLHFCAAVKPVQGGGEVRFVSLDAPDSERETGPPLFAGIMRRRDGVKILECHVFICKSNQAALALVKSCTHAFEHREGWGNEETGSGTRIVSGEGRDGVESGGVREGGSFFGDNAGLIQKFDVACKVGESPRAAQQASQLQACLQPTVTSQPITGHILVPVNPAAGPLVPLNSLVPSGAPVPSGALVPVAAGHPGAYFADWGSNPGQPVMIIPDSPFCPNKKNKKKTGKKKKVPTATLR